MGTNGFHDLDPGLVSAMSRVKSKHAKHPLNTLADQEAAVDASTADTIAVECIDTPHPRHMSVSAVTSVTLPERHHQLVAHKWTTMRTRVGCTP
jgi:hypothetical protein